MTLRQGVGWGLPWVTRAPREWELLRMRHALQLSSLRNEDGSRDRLLSLSVSKGVIPKVYEDQSLVRSGDELRKYFLVQPGQFVVNPMWLMHGSLGASEVSGVISPSYRVYDLARGVNPRYLHYLLKTREYQDLYASLARGPTTYDRCISKDAFDDLPLLLPPILTQNAVVDFLDRKTAAIDAAIAKKQRLLALLEEKRAAVVNQAVTKGLDPSVPMKDSGIPWMGQIPAHWQLMRLKRLVSHTVDCQHSTPDYRDDGAHPALRTSDVHLGVLDISGARRVSKEDYAIRISRFKPASGDIIYNREGERYGIAAQVPKDVEPCLAQRVMLLRSKKYNDGGYVMWALNSKAVFSQMQRLVIGATSPHINVVDVRAAWVPRPSLTEQVRIARALNKETRAGRSVMENINLQLERLTEYRQALITAAVTGQLTT